MDVIRSSGEEEAAERPPLRRNRSHHAYRMQPPDGVRVRGRMRWPTRTGGASGVRTVVASRTRISALTSRRARLDATADTRDIWAKIALYR